jgi:sugar/nucleoside kinase (ribokinase family)
LAVPAFPIQPIDPTGAGDCYDAAFVVGLLSDWPLTQVARFANAVGALATTELGPMEGSPNREQVNNFLRHYASLGGTATSGSPNTYTDW